MWFYQFILDEIAASLKEIKRRLGVYLLIAAVFTLVGYLVGHTSK